jgi:hypothetical protein
VTKPPPLQVVPTPRTSLDHHQHHQSRPDDVEYYNDLPGKTPPAFSPGHKQRTARGKVIVGIKSLKSDF